MCPRRWVRTSRGVLGAASCADSGAPDKRQRARGVYAEVSHSHRDRGDRTGVVPDPGRLRSGVGWLLWGGGSRGSPAATRRVLRTGALPRLHLARWLLELGAARILLGTRPLGSAPARFSLGTPPLGPRRARLADDRRPVGPATSLSAIELRQRRTPHRRRSVGAIQELSASEVASRCQLSARTRRVRRGSGVPSSGRRSG